MGMNQRAAGEASASALIDKRIKELGDWRGQTLAQIRQLIHEAVPEVIEEWKWMGTPVWSHGGIICTGESYKNVVKMTFLKGASLDDPTRLFNSSLDGNARRAIDIREGEKIDVTALKNLFAAAAALNLGGKTGAKKAKAGAKKAKTKAVAKKAKAGAKKTKSVAKKARTGAKKKAKR